MKKLLFIFLLTFSLAANAQKKTKISRNLFSHGDLKNAASNAPANPLYTFSTFTASYQEFTGTVLSGGLLWDDLSFPIPLGFSFELYNVQGSTINFAEGSFVTFNNPNASIVTLATPMFEDLCDRAFDPNSSSEGDPGGISDISYSVTGIPGNRICMIQVKNAGFFGEIDANDTSVSYANFQVWLYEGSNDLEMRFGNVNILNQGDNFLNPTGFLCGLAEQVNINTAANVSANVLSGAAANPTMLGLSASLAEVVTGPIQSGRVYKFSRVHPNLVGITKNNSSEKLSFFPNPASKTLYCKIISELMNEAEIYLYSFNGRLVSTKNLESLIDLSEINKGVYLLKAQLKTGEYIYSGKLVITD